MERCALSCSGSAPSDETLAGAMRQQLLFSSSCRRAVMLARCQRLLASSEPLHLDCSSAKELSLLVAFCR